MNTTELNSIFYKADISDETLSNTFNLADKSNQSDKSNVSVEASLNKNITMSSKLFSNSLMSDFQNTPTIHSKLIDIHRTVLNSDFIPEASDEPSIQQSGGSMNDSDTSSNSDDSITGTTTSISTTKSSIEIPLNSSDVLTSEMSSINTTSSTTQNKFKKTDKQSKIPKDKLNRMFFY